MIEPLVQRAIVLHAVLVVVLVLIGNNYGIDQAYLTSHGAWVPILIVNAGILAGNLAMAVLGLSDESSTVMAQGRREDLEHGRAVVVEQLRALDAERDKLTAEDYATERARLVMVGAGALRELEDVAATISAPAPTTSSAPAPAPTPVQAAELLKLRETDPAAFEAALARLAAPAPQPAGMSGEWRGAAYALAAVALCALLVTYASNDAKERGPGGSMTGGDSVAPMGGGGMGGGPMGGGGGMGGAEAPASAEPPDPRIAELEAKVTANPKDAASLDDLTELYLASRDLNGAMRSNARALEADPNDIDATVFRAVLRAFIGRRDQAVTDLNAVLAAHPDQLRALVYMGLLSMQTDPAKAVEMLEKATKQDPSPELQGALAEARRRLAGGPEPEQPAMGGGGPMGGGGGPMGGGGAPMGGGGGQLLASGTIELGNPSESGQVLFVSVQGSQPGPPLAALKLPPGPFPMKFEITTANIIPMMAGRPLPPTFSVVARLDSDGDPMTRPPTDPSARADGLSAGTANLVLKLP